MKCYMVGGAVRDKLLGLPQHDRDWVVVGATVHDMLSKGFRQVGKDFPVFLHPVTGEEYALARTERKIGKGYYGFGIHASIEVTLEEDLARRDLTINAIAEDENGHVIDPHNGLYDIKNKILRHVSPAFSEDPVRVLRLAKFAARLPDFSIANETWELVCQMVNSGEVTHLIPERVWQELSDGLHATQPYRMWEILSNCGALACIAYGFNEAWQQHTASISNGYTSSRFLNFSSEERFAIMARHMSVQQATQTFEHLRSPRAHKELAILIAKEANNLSKINRNTSAHEWLSIIERCDGLRRSQRLASLRNITECMDNWLYGSLMEDLVCELKKIDIASVLRNSKSNEDIVEEIHKARLKVVTHYLRPLQN